MAADIFHVEAAAGHEHTALFHGLTTGLPAIGQRLVCLDHPGRRQINGAGTAAA